MHSKHAKKKFKYGGNQWFDGWGTRVLPKGVASHTPILETPVIHPNIESYSLIHPNILYYRVIKGTDKS